MGAEQHFVGKLEKAVARAMGISQLYGLSEHSFPGELVEMRDCLTQKSSV